MKKITRRHFIKYSVMTGAATAISSTMNTTSYARILGANDEIRVAVVGFNSKGAQHIKQFREIPGVRIVALCDVDKDIVEREAARFAETNDKVDKYTDMRKVLDDKNIDVVVIATPNHWHSLAAIWAIQAGKDVYVEKPISHNIWEGRKVIEAARKYNRIVQSGTQNRSDIGLRGAYDYIKAGNLGKILWTHGLWYKKRESIGRVRGAQPIPSQVDYDLWTGPAKLMPLLRKNLHYDWHWFWNTGNGDMANIGVHQIDDCRFILDDPDLPTRVFSFGGRFNFDDNAETPNTQFAYFEFESAPPMIIETRNLPMKAGINAMNHVRGVRAGNIIQCEHGYFAGGRGGGWIYDNDNKKIKQFPGDGGGGHQANFIDAVRSRNKDELHSEILQGHISSVLCHMANISYCLGKETPAEQIKEVCQQDKQASDTFEKIQSHIQANEINLQKTPLTLGPWLDVDIKKEKFKGEFGKQANKYVSREYRKPFVVPKKV